MTEDQIEAFAEHHFGFDMDAAIKEIADAIETGFRAIVKKRNRELNRLYAKRKEARRRRVGGRKS